MMMPTLLAKLINRLSIKSGLQLYLRYIVSIYRGGSIAFAIDVLTRNQPAIENLSLVAGNTS